MSKSVNILAASKRKLAAMFIEHCDEYYVSTFSSEGKLVGDYEDAVRKTAWKSSVDDLRFFFIRTFVDAIQDKEVVLLMDLSSLLSRHRIHMCGYGEMPADLVLSAATSSVVAYLDAQ
jgi:hypothetical protein